MGGRWVGEPAGPDGGGRAATSIMPCTVLTRPAPLCFSTNVKSIIPSSLLLTRWLLTRDETFHYFCCFFYLFVSCYFCSSAACRLGLRLGMGHTLLPLAILLTSLRAHQMCVAIFAIWTSFVHKAVVNHWLCLVQSIRKKVMTRTQRQDEQVSSSKYWEWRNQNVYLSEPFRQKDALNSVDL